MSSPSRAIRKCKELNPELPVWKITDGWLMTFIDGAQATDLQIANKVIDTYRTSRNIVVDAFINNNVLAYTRESDSKVVCIDVDVALRRGSEDSDEYSSNMLFMHKNKLNQITRKRAKTAEIILNLLYLQEHSEDNLFIKDEYITLQIIELLTPYRKEKIVITLEIMNYLYEHTRPLFLDNSKQLISTLSSENLTITASPVPVLPTSSRQLMLVSPLMRQFSIFSPPLIRDEITRSNMNTPTPRGEYKQ